MATAPSVIPGYRRDKDWDREREMLFPLREGQTHTLVGSPVFLN